jgi:hypothetical protein
MPFITKEPSTVSSNSCFLTGDMIIFIDDIDALELIGSSELEARKLLSYMLNSLYRNEYISELVCFGRKSQLVNSSNDYSPSLSEYCVNR